MCIGKSDMSEVMAYSSVYHSSVLAGSFFLRHDQPALFITVVAGVVKVEHEIKDSQLIAGASQLLQCCLFLPIPVGILCLDIIQKTCR